jgi:replication-associated recombination protein RarA
VYLRDPNSSPIDVGVRTKQAPGEKYVYSQDVNAGEFGGATGQDYLGVPKIYYQPGNSGAEAAIAKRLEELRAMKKMNQQ